MSRQTIRVYFGEKSPLFPPSSQNFSSNNTSPTLIGSPTTDSEISKLEFLTQALYVPGKKSLKTSNMKCAEVFDKGFEPEHPTDQEVSATTSTLTEATTTTTDPPVIGPAVPPTGAASQAGKSERDSGSSGYSGHTGSAASSGSDGFLPQDKLMEQFLGSERQLMNAENHIVELNAALQRAVEAKSAAEEIIARQRQEDPVIDADAKFKELKAALDVAIAARKDADKVAARKEKEYADLIKKHAEVLEVEKEKYYADMKHVGDEFIAEERKYQDHVHDLEEEIKELSEKGKRWKEKAKEYKAEVKQTEELYGVEIGELVKNHEAAIKALREDHQKAIDALPEGASSIADLKSEHDALIDVLVRNHEMVFALFKKKHEEVVGDLKQKNKAFVESLLKRHKQNFDDVSATYDKHYQMDRAASKKYETEKEKEFETLKKEYNKKLRGIKQDYEAKLQNIQRAAPKVTFDIPSLANSASKIKLENSAPAKMGRSKSTSAIGISEQASPTKQSRSLSSNIMNKLGYSPIAKMSRTTSKNSIGSAVDADDDDNREEMIARLKRNPWVNRSRRVDALGLYTEEGADDKEDEIERAGKDFVWTKRDQKKYDRDMKELNEAFPRLCAEALIRRDALEAKEPGSTRGWVVPKFEAGVAFDPRVKQFTGLRWCNMMPLGRSPHLH